MWKIILYGLLFWFLYNLIFRFIIPVYMASKRMKRQFSEMKDKMQEKMNEQQAENVQPTPKPGSGKKAAEDYIDFEEVK